ncbi:MAG: 4Fe-4S binding protein [Firmicutes bacterium]|nr:4Fe-4S binding protein [Bacillota bacterium]MBQ6842124.1 4Fe-4S binding protein [Bacillota bacterium]
MRKGIARIGGMALRHFMLKKPATISYPHGPLQLEPGYRGKIEYHGESCIGCMLCAKDCPAGAIKIVNVGTPEKKQFEMRLDYAHCIFCAQCVDSCRKGCLSFTDNIELAGFSRGDLKSVTTGPEQPPTPPKVAKPAAAKAAADGAAPVKKAAPAAKAEAPAEKPAEAPAKAEAPAEKPAEAEAAAEKTEG